MKTIQINREHLRAALHTSGVQDVPYYLNGVCVEVMLKETRIISTDGKVLSVFRTMIENPEHCQFIISNEVIKGIKKSDSNITVEIDDGKYALIDGATRIGFTPIDVKYPDYRRVFPLANYESKPSQYNPDLLVKFAKIAKQLTCGTEDLHIKHNGILGALVRILTRPDFAGVIMPMRYDESKLESASWVSLTP